MTLPEFTKIFEPKLQCWVQDKINTYSQYTHDQHALEWIGYINQLLQGGGKRIRPYLVCLIANKENREQQVWDIAIALELFHLFCLIHDDIIDAGESRRGVTTAHRYIAQRLKDENRRCDAEHIGFSHALLLGDLVLSWVYELINGSGASPALKLVFQQMVDEVVVGQMIDVEIMTRDRVSERLILEKMYLKTASYTFIRPLLLGACMNESSAELKSFCQSFGNNLGLAFQIQDDILDLTVPQSISGKTAFSDLRDRQHTFFTQHIIEKGSAEQKEQLCSIWGKDLTEQDRSQVDTLFTKSGAIKYGTDRMNEFFALAEKDIERITIPIPIKEALSTLTTYLRKRTA